MPPLFSNIFVTVNAGYAQAMYEQWLEDPSSVDESWRALFENGTKGLEPPAHPPAPRPAAAPAAPAAPAGAAAPAAPAGVTPLKGPAARLAANMTESLSVPTATSFRDVNVGVLDARRRELNAAVAPKKISFTHLIGFAIVQAAKVQRSMTHAFAEVDGAPHRVDPGGVNLGLAVDVEKKDGSRFLVVPVIRNAEPMDFAAFHATYEALVGKARANQLMPDDFKGATITLTNPGTIGTTASVPRLMAGQGTIVATGAIRAVGADRVMTITSTYDHRIIQGAESGTFLKRIDQLLQGEERFYETVFGSLGAGSRQQGAVPPAPSSLPPAPSVAGSGVEDLKHVAAAMALVRAHRIHGHRAAHLDPLGSEPPGDPALDPEPLGLTPDVMSRIPAEVLRVYVPGATLAEAFPALKRTYCGTIAYEVEHISSHEERVWLRKVIESGEHRRAPTPEERKQLLARLAQVEGLERFLHKAYLGQKRFSIEGLDVLVPMLDLTIQLAGAGGARDVVMGMAHRGRLNVLAHIVNLPYEKIFAEFEGAGGRQEGTDRGTGDVKYHHGAEGVYQTTGGKAVTVALASNPSHLEAVNPVVEGQARAAQTARSGRDVSLDGSVALPVLLHGDASFAGQGVVAETFNLARLKGYTTGGTMHFIANNQIGFTTEPQEARSTDYSSDLAKGFDVPIVHVNADDPEACLAAVRLAMLYRAKFHGDVVIDVVGYRRHGHNEADEPAYTQPLMYERIKATPTVRQRYADQLVRDGVLPAADADAMAEQAYQRLADIQQRLKASLGKAAPAQEPQRISRQMVAEPKTAVPQALLVSLNEALLAVPAGFTVSPKLKKQLDRRRETLPQGAGIEWAHAEALAFAALLTEGIPIRLTGQDTERGTFSQRHLVLHDANDGRRHAPIQNLPDARAAFELHNSPLSEYACLGFEYGYAAAVPEVLVLWEAQFGDFANGAEVIIDQFITAGLAKWGATSRLTMLLPHGYEGQGPEHSSARVERYLALGAEGNIRVANCTTPVQYFHLLRRQAKHEELRPLVVMTPKSLLRLPQATSHVEDFASGKFQAVLDDPAVKSPGDVRRLVLCSGKVYYDIVSSKERAAATRVAVGRVELLYPFPALDLKDLLERYPKLEEVVWAQEEPRNFGARKFVLPKLRDVAGTGIVIKDVSRPERSSPAEGYPGAHQAEQARIVKEALTV